MHKGDPGFQNLSRDCFLLITLSPRVDFFLTAQLDMGNLSSDSCLAQAQIWSLFPVKHSVFMHILTYIFLILTKMVMKC